MLSYHAIRVSIDIHMLRINTAYLLKKINIHMPEVIAARMKLPKSKYK